MMIFLYLIIYVEFLSECWQDVICLCLEKRETDAMLSLLLIFKLSSISALFILLFHVKPYCFCADVVTIRWPSIVLKAQEAR